MMRGLLKIPSIGILLLYLTLGIINTLSAEEREADHEALRQILAITKEAVNTDQLDKLTPYLANGFSITMIDQAHIKSVAELKQYFHKYFKAENSILTGINISPEADILTEFIADNVGINYGHSIDVFTLRTGQNIEFQTRWTATTVKENDMWKLKTLHVGSNIIENPIIAAEVAVRYTWGGVGLFIGLLLGFVGFKLMKGKRT